MSKNFQSNKYKEQLTKEDKKQEKQRRQERKKARGRQWIGE